MDEKDFELLCTLDSTCNITYAAEKLHVSQSALSKRIKMMEKKLGVEIVLRSRQGICFTPAGKIILEHSRVAAHEMAQMRKELERKYQKDQEIFDY